MCRYYLHRWKIVSGYFMSKYDEIVQANTGYDSIAEVEIIARKYTYQGKRDDSFDFMQLGEDDFEYYFDGYP
jgi:hypothetical protein